MFFKMAVQECPGCGADVVKRGLKKTDLTPYPQIWYECGSYEGPCSVGGIFNPSIKCQEKSELRKTFNWWEVV